MISSTVLYIGLAYVVGTAFGYAVALTRGRREGIEIGLDSLIANGYLRTGVHDRGETVIYQYWEERT